MTERPRVLFVGRARYRLPLPAWLAKKWDAVEQELDYRVIGAATEDSGPSDDRFRLARPARPRRLDGLLFYLRLPLRLRREIQELPARRRSSRPILSRRRGARRSGTRPPAGAGDRRGARRLADVLAAVRLTCTPADQSSCRRGRGPGGPAGRRDARCLELHGGPRRGDARGAARALSSRRSVTCRRSPSGARLAPRTADGGVRRRARGVQERRGACRRLAARRRSRACCRPRDRRQRARSRRSSTELVADFPGRVEHDDVARARGGLRAARCCDGARAAVLAGGPRPRDHRIVRPGTRRSSRRTAAGFPIS